MNIYRITLITDKILDTFKPTRLYIKELAGIKYFGKTTQEDIYKYTGSGKIWKDRMKKYGRKNVKTLWVSDYFYCPYYIQQFALMFSELNQIVESKEWANYRPEDGLSGGDVMRNNPNKDSIRQKISNTANYNMSLLTNEEKSKKFGTFGEDNYFYEYNKTLSKKDRQKKSCIYSYKIKSPEGKEFKTNNLLEFCLSMNLNRDILMKYANKGITVPTPRNFGKESRMNTIGWRIDKSEVF